MPTCWNTYSASIRTKQKATHDNHQTHLRNLRSIQPTATGHEPTCANLVILVIHHVDAQDRPIVIRQQPNATFWCDDHQTTEEEAAKDAAIGKFWQRLGIAQKGKQ